MREVNLEIVKILRVGADDIEDFDYRMVYEIGGEPRETAREALKAAGFPLDEMTHEATYRCECEHVAHSDRPYQNGMKDPHPRHTCTQKFPASQLEEVRTIYGVYKMCAPCAKALPSQFRMS